MVVSSLTGAVVLAKKDRYSPHRNEAGEYKEEIMATFVSLWWLYMLVTIVCWGIGISNQLRMMFWSGFRTRSLLASAAMTIIPIFIGTITFGMFVVACVAHFIGHG